ncbi:MAG: glucose-6-phosphate isomerase [Proteobacteria bacterium]|nr:glucose-6-phosphate isomerase [Pseudomonadota bacterium]
MLNKINPESTVAWKKLEHHYKKIQAVHMRHLFENDSQRFKKFSIPLKGLFFDYSKNIIDDETIKLFVELAEEIQLKAAIDSMFSGEKINETENRSVLHIALRNFSNTSICVDGKNVMEDIHAVLAIMKEFSEKIRRREWKGYTGENIKDIVNIGIGGSDLGPKMVCEALKFYAHDSLNIHFISNIDGAHLSETLKNLDPRTTLFMIASKSFTTHETITNAYSAREWFLRSARDDRHIAKHFVALSTNEAEVTTFGIDKKNMFKFWDFVGGRYSLWSAIGLPIACYIGFDNFRELLEGAHDMDEHFQAAPFDQNIPVILGLLGIWYTNFFKAETEAIFPYNQYLHRLPAYLQQANMESNGKCVDRNGNTVSYPTCPIVWGEPGTNGQHAFFQLLHQGTPLIPATLIASVEPLNHVGNHHHILLSNFLAQSEALMRGRDAHEVRDDLQSKGMDEQAINKILPYKVFKGNKPSNSILLDRLTPRTLGNLIAMYEHKIFVQGVIWNIFSFDQWGVELGKQLSQKILDQLDSGGHANGHDASTNGLINLINHRP